MMKKENDYRWIPCSPWAWKVGEFQVTATTDGDLLALQYAKILTLKFRHQKLAAGVEATIVGAEKEALPVIQII